MRIVSATNQNLEEKLGKAALREDFYYRINAEHILVPSLRERREDIVPLIAFCLCGNGNGQRVARIEQSALKCLQRYPWPGNVRELFAVLERVKYISNGDIVTLEMLPDRIKEAQAAPPSCLLRDSDGWRRRAEAETEKGARPLRGEQERGGSMARHLPRDALQAAPPFGSSRLLQ